MSIACERVALQHSKQSVAGALAHCIMLCNVHGYASSVKCMPREHTWHVRREQLWSKPKAMEYSMRSNCLVSLFEGGDIYQTPDGYISSVTVLDLAAGARMLCQLEDRM